MSYLAAEFFPANDSNLRVQSTIFDEGDTATIVVQPLAGYVLLRDFDVKGAENYLVPVNEHELSNQYEGGWAADLLNDFLHGRVKFTDLPISPITFKAANGGR